MKIDPSFVWTAFVQLLSAIPTTLMITAVSVSVGFVIGVITALFRLYRVPVLGQISTAYVTFIRGTPMLTHLLLIYFGLPVIIDGLSEGFGWGFKSASIPMIAFAYISFSITAGAYMSEVVRSGLLAVNRGQLEAAYSIGMTTFQALRRIVFPRRWRSACRTCPTRRSGCCTGRRWLLPYPSWILTRKRKSLPRPTGSFLRPMLRRR